MVATREGVAKGTENIKTSRFIGFIMVYSVKSLVMMINYNTNTIMLYLLLMDQNYHEISACVLY